jgi:CPA2 family monovalent cation:H+ antiporter-2
LHDPLLTKSLILIASSVVAVAALRRLGLPAILGYLAAGLVVGPQGLNLVVADDATRFFADLGLVFLLFTVGLEFSLPAMLAGRGDVFLAGIAQVALTTAVAAALAALSGAGATASILTGGAVASSSTAVVLKELSDRGEIGSSAGRLTVGLLLFQDLATLPFIVFVGAFAGLTAEPLAIARHAALGGMALVAAAVLGRPLFHGALDWVAERRSAELLLLAVLLSALGAAWIAGLAGLTAPLGAFMAGMLVGESDLRHHAEDQIHPIRDVLMGLFFITVGMGLDLSAAIDRPLIVLAWLAVFLIAKPAIVLLVGKLRRWPGEDGLRTALALGNGGEFGLLLLSQALAFGLVAPNVARPALIALVASMGFAPVLISGWPALARHLGRLAPPPSTAAITQAAEQLDEHVILCGCGRIGRPVAAALGAGGIAYVALEKDFRRYREARAQGLRTLFADASRAGALAAAGLGRSRLLVLTFDAEPDAGRILHWAKHERPGAHRLASASDESSASELAARGADVVFPENLAAGLGLADQALLLSGLDQDAAARLVTELRAKLNPELAASAGL